MQANPPLHVAVVMDGNGRWAERNGVSKAEGHKKGAEVARSLLQWAGDEKIRYLTLFAFSSENWSRPQKEVDAIFRLLVMQIEMHRAELKQKGVRVRFVGDLDRLEAGVRLSIEGLQEELASESRLHLQIALSYGGRSEIAAATRSLAAKVQSGAISPADINEQSISEHLYTNGLPDPDLLIRTSGEQRISNFLLWQLAYTELYFTECLWPDFDLGEFRKALRAFEGRSRRFGGRSTVKPAFAESSAAESRIT